MTILCTDVNQIINFIDHLYSYSKVNSMEHDGEDIYYDTWITSDGWEKSKLDDEVQLSMLYVDRIIKFVMSYLDREFRLDFNNWMVGIISKGRHEDIMNIIEKLSLIIIDGSNFVLEKYIQTLIYGTIGGIKIEMYDFITENYDIEDHELFTHMAGYNTLLFKHCCETKSDLIHLKNAMMRSIDRGNIETMKFLLDKFGKEHFDEHESIARAIDKCLLWNLDIEESALVLLHQYNFCLTEKHIDHVFKFIRRRDKYAVLLLLDINFDFSLLDSYTDDNSDHIIKELTNRGFGSDTIMNLLSLMTRH